MGSELVVSVSLVLSGLSLALVLILGAKLFRVAVELRAMKESTHSVQFMPADTQFQKMTEEVQKAMQKDIFEEV